MSRALPRTLASLLLTMLVVGACRGGRDQVTTGGGAPAADSSTTAAPSTTVAPAATTTTARSTTTKATGAGRSTTTAARATTTSAARPKVVVPRQGDRVVAVFVATGSSLDDPSFARAKARLAELGYKGYSGGDTACSQGAEEALPQLREYSLSLEFATRRDADRFAALYGPVLGIATVTVFCAD